MKLVIVVLYDESEILTKSEIFLLGKCIESCRNNSIKKYSFSEKEINESMQENQFDKSILDKLISKQIMKYDLLQRCRKCGNDIDYCTCVESELEEIKYLQIDIGIFSNYIIRTIEYIYNIQLVSQLTFDNGITFKMKKSKGEEFNFKLYFNRILQDFLTGNSQNPEIIISIMPLKSDQSDLYVFEWSEFLINTDKIKDYLKDYYIKIKSKDFYFIDVGDDMDILEIETIRDKLRIYLKVNGFVNFTETPKYKPECIDYSIPIEKIKECFIFQDKKILIIKPSERELCIALFKDGLINSDDDLYKIIRKFDIFIKGRIERFRELSREQEEVNSREKIIQLSGPIINVIAFVIGLVSKSPVLSSVNVFLTSKVVLWIVIIINALSTICIVVFSIIPYIRISFFKWDRGLCK